MTGRMRSLQAKLVEKGLPAYLVTAPPNLRYLSGFTGSAGALLVTPDGAWLFADPRYLEQAREEAPGCVLVPRPGKLSEALAPLLREQGVGALAFEKERLTFAQYERLRQELEAELLPQAGLVEELRLVKEEGEVEAIRKAAALADQAFGHVLEMVRPGVSEQDIALELEYYMRREGASAAAFPLIVASGPRAAFPHGVPSARRLQGGDLVVMDLGCVVDGYCSDLTRTVVVGRADEKQRRIFELVRRAQEAGLAALRAGRKGSEVDAAAREVIAAAGYGEHFGHGLGHGVGLEIHEGPRLSRLAAGPEEPELRAGMVVTVEPGVYIPGWGGVRVEDLVLVGEEEARALSRADKRLWEL